MNDPIGARQPRHSSNGLLLKAAVVIPDVLISSLLWLVIIAALPPAAGLALLIAGGTLGALLAAGLGEDAAVRVLYRARRATPSEAPRLTVAWRVATHHLDGAGVRLRIVTAGAPVATAGRRHLLLRRDVVVAYCDNEINAQQVAALITQGLGRLRHGHTRFDLLWTFWTIPWDFLRGLAQTIGRRLAWIPLVQLAWRTRIVVGAIAVILEAQAGRWPSPIILAAFLTLSYVKPLWRRAWERWCASLEPTSTRPTHSEQLLGLNGLKAPPQEKAGPTNRPEQQHWDPPGKRARSWPTRMRAEACLLPRQIREATVHARLATGLGSRVANRTGREPQPPAAGPHGDAPLRNVLREGPPTSGSS